MFVADPASSRIWEWHRGRFTVVAGDGRRGFSGDGGPARRAELSSPGGMAYDQHGKTLYIADSGNNRIRAIGPTGKIRTVAGGGQTGPWRVSSGAPARTARILDPEDVALSPSGRLEIAASGSNQILTLTPTGRLVILAGDRHSAGVDGVGGPARAASPDGPSGLGYDQSGNLWITGQNTKNVLVIAHGLMREPPHSPAYARGPGQIQAAADGGVYVGDTQQIYRYTVTSRHLIADYSDTTIGGTRTIALVGLATVRDELYFDTSANDGWSNRSALFRLDLATGSTEQVTALPLGAPH